MREGNALQVFYDENNETIYIGNKGNKITKEDFTKGL